MRPWFLVVLLGCLSSGAAEPVASGGKDLTTTLAAMSTGQLIHRLRWEGVRSELSPDGTPRIKVPFFDGVFVTRTMRQAPRHETGSPVRAELVRRGVEALPMLLKNLSNDSPTHVVAVQPGWGSVDLSDHHDPRYADPARMPPGVNRTPRSGEPFPHNARAYVYTVGDLCLEIVKEIINRGTPRDQLFGNASVIFSPTQYPALAEAVRTDWAGLTREAHAQSLRGDALEMVGGRPGWRAHSAVPRLLYYYPDIGKQVVAELLSRKVAADDVANGPDGQIEAAWQVSLIDEWLPDEEWPGLREQLWAVYGATKEMPKADERLMLACARRLMGGAHDAELRRDFEALAEAQQAALQRGGLDGVQERLAREAVERYRVFLQSFPAGR